LKGHLREKIREYTIKFGFFPLFFDDGASDSNYLKKIFLSLQASNDQLLFFIWFGGAKLWFAATKR